jgi:hypothetical protein
MSKQLITNMFLPIERSFFLNQLISQPIILSTNILVKLPGIEIYQEKILGYSENYLYLFDLTPNLIQNQHNTLPIGFY